MIRYIVFLCASLFLQSCFFIVGLFIQPDEGANCRHHKPEFCSDYLNAYKKDWIDRQKFADTRQYFGNFDLFNQVGTALPDTFNPVPIDNVGWDETKLDSLYMYKISWADSFYLYHYRSPHIAERCICDIYDGGTEHSFEEKRPVWKFYQLKDSVFFSTRFSVLKNIFFYEKGGVFYRDSFLHQPQKILWKRTEYSWDYETKQFKLRYQNERKKKKPLIYTYQLNRLEMSADLFWQITTYQSPKLSSRKIPNFSMDSLIRSFQK